MAVNDVFSLVREEQRKYFKRTIHDILALTLFMQIVKHIDELPVFVWRHSMITREIDCPDINIAMIFVFK